MSLTKYAEREGARIIIEVARSNRAGSGDQKMEIVITMAGLGLRFKEAGYSEPKYMIKALGKTLFSWSMDSLAAFRREEDRYIFLVRKEDQAAEFIRESARALGIAKSEIIELSEATDGQATTALLASSVWRKEEPLYVYNIDTYVEPFYITPQELRGDGFIPCFSAPGEHWSFVRLEDNNDLSSKAVEVREKKRISDHCTLGAYYFSSCGLYEELYQEYYEEGKRLDQKGKPVGKNQGDKPDIRSEAERRERYIAPLYDYMTGKGMEVYISSVPKEKVHVLGTPEELNAFIGRVQ